MWSTKFVLFGALTLILVSQACSIDNVDKLPLYDDYLQMPKLNELDDEYHTNVREAILKLDFNQETTSDQLNEMIIQSRDADNSPHKEVYRTLADFLRSDRKTIHESSIRVIKSILAQVRAKKSDKLELFGQILKKAFSDRFKRFTRTHGAMKFPNNINKFDRLFLKAFDFKRQIGKRIYLEDITEKLITFNWAEDDMKVGRMMRVASGVGAFLLAKKEESLSVLKDYIDRNCDHLEEFRETFDIYNLMIPYKVEQPFSHYRERFNEYNRLCLAWAKRETKKKIWQNIKKQLQDNGSATSAKV